MPSQREQRSARCLDGELCLVLARGANRTQGASATALTETRERGIDQRLSDHRDRLRRDPMPALLGTRFAARLFLDTLMSPDKWA